VVVTKYQGDYRYPDLNDQSLRDAVLARIQVLGPDTRATPENLVLRTITHDLPSKLAVAVIQITGQRPVAVEDMRRFGDAEVSAVQDKEIRDHAGEENGNPFSYKAVSDRLKYKPVRGPDSTDAATPAGPAEPATDKSAADKGAA